MDDVTRSVTYDWHSPRCSSCGALIKESTDCLAGWFEDDQYRSFCPFVCHTGDRCDFYRLVGVRGLRDLPIDRLRRAPMEAIKPALRRRDADPTSRANWSDWVSIVLGLPFCQFDSTLDLKCHGAVADLLADRVTLAPDFDAALNAARKRRSTAA